MRTQRYRSLVSLQPSPPNLCWTPPVDDSEPLPAKRLDWGSWIYRAAWVVTLAWLGLYLAVFA